MSLPRPHISSTEAPTTIGLTEMAYRLPAGRLSLDDAARRDLLTSDAAFLRDIGFGHCFVEDDPATHEDMIVECGREVLDRSEVPVTEVGWLFRCSGLPGELPVTAHRRHDAVLDRFRYPAVQSQERLRLHRASAMALSQQGCSGLLSGLFIAHKLLQGDSAGAVLLLAGDVIPPGGRREILYNVMSDAAGAVLVEKHARKNRIIHFVQQAMPYYWDTPLHTTEMLASYFPMAQRVILRTLEEAGFTAANVDWVVPHNVSLRSWTILADLVGIPAERVWTGNIARVGHTVSCDHIINLCDMEREGALRAGDLILLFTFGFGATWTCLLIQH